MKSGNAEGSQKSISKDPWKTGMLIYLPVTSQPLISCRKKRFFPPCNFTTTHLAACVLKFYLPLTSQRMKRRTLSQHPMKTRPNACDASSAILSQKVLRDMEVSCIGHIPLQVQRKRITLIAVWVGSVSPATTVIA